MRKRLLKPKLYQHQEEGRRRALDRPFYSLFMEQGTGKTAVAIKVMEDRFRSNQIQRIMIEVPNTLTYNWELEIQKFISLKRSDYTILRLNHRKKDSRLADFNKFISKSPDLCTLSQLKDQGFIGKTKKDILDNTKPHLLILIINYEKVRVMPKELKKFNPQMLIVDESHKLRNRNAQISKNTYKLSRSCDYRLLMTGTPICGGHEDIFMQFKIMDESILGSNYGQFERQFIEKGGYMGKEIVGYKKVNKLKRIIRKNSYRVLINDCVDLPPLITKTLYSELDGQSLKAYKEMNQEMLTTIENSNLPTRSELKELCRTHGVDYHSRESYASLLLKLGGFINISSCELAITQILRLKQITGGFLTLDDGSIIRVGSEKINMVKELLDGSPLPVLIYCEYVPEIDLVVNELSKSKQLRVKSFRDKKNRDQVYKDFTDGSIDVLVLQNRSGSVGLNLQRASRIIMYSYSHSADDYVQIVARIKRSGQTRPMEIIHLAIEGSIDQAILEVISHKRKLADNLLDN